MAAKIIVVGLGSGDEKQLTLGIVDILKEAKKLYLRTEEHPVTRWLREQQIGFDTFDSVYEQFDDFTEVYEEICHRLMEEAEHSSDAVVYAVPGHPSVAETTVMLLREQCGHKRIELDIQGGESFLDQVFLRLGLDPVNGFQLLDAGRMHHNQLNPRLHTIVTQVYDTFTASDVKLTLMNIYPDSMEVTVAHSLGIQGEEKMERVPLYEIDRLQYGNRSLIWIPKQEEDEVLNRTFDQLVDIVRVLRSPEGCPWDREQTHQSLRKYLIEETYEVIETIDDDDPAAMEEELGDVLLQVMLHAQIESEEGGFDVWDVIRTLNEKLIRRHPHVFGARSAKNVEEALTNWDEMKKKEKEGKAAESKATSLLDSVPRGLPALMKAVEYQKKAAKVGFDWERLEDVLDKLSEEVQELEEAHRSGEAQHAAEELGDVLFAAVNAARFLKIDPEAALNQTNRKFKHRFGYIEEQLRLKNKDLENTGLEEMENLWQQAKKYEF
ncbi:nucleoside triphosphate pyrophosphohydrolase [Marinicrinis lubricantis]|uniref:Nucleoside triphosphate pyrophosphohydrolase n=1 Tax=Marinicrinis lubricantis TaxID=2086470 RepID=A0ABW1IQC4_9BACL